ncbi:MAG: undecaprenyl-diphosphate phosphatase [Ruminococcus sp.]|nr:undecaprenyl-diphosphate phosphatase [Ruminococcus sp.]MCM1480934.1 undecaprenyl-diphosphate phosphatase [Muribaculaceae bacterium]
MTILEGFLQGILQGLTEFLPVSSSGHLSLFQHFTGLDGEGAATMTIVLHLGTLVAVFIAFWGKIKALIFEAFRLLRDLFTGKFKWREMNPERRMIMMIIVSILPLFGFYIFRDFFKGLEEDTDILVEGFAFLYTSALLFLSTRVGGEEGAHSRPKKTAGETTVPAALTIGVFQGIALVPGISRSGSTISAALFTGMKRADAVEYSFILGIPVILAGAVVQLGDAAGSELTANILPLAVGFAAAAVSGYFAIRLTKLLVANDKFRVFAWYTLVLGIVVIGLALYENFSGVRILINK